MKNLLLPLPYPVKFAGLLLMLAGLILGVAYLWLDFRFTLPVFAIFSSFLETKMFVTFNTNFADELVLLLILSGLGLIIFSKEKNESEYIERVREKAFARALIWNTVLLLISILFIYGSGFIGMLVINLFSFSLFFLFFFFLLKHNDKIEEKSE